MTSPSRTVALERWFPYMCFARREAMASKYSLCSSGMPAADPALFESLRGVDLSYAGAGALPELQDVLAARFGVTRERVLVTLGTSGAMNIVAAALFRPGARVVAETPSYEPLRALPRRAGAELRTVERRLDRQWRMDLAAVERELAGAAPGHVFLTTPHNPSGARTALEDLRALAGLAGNTGGVLISNEIYEEFIPPERAQRAASSIPNAISLGSLTKAYGLGALRVGWIVLGADLAGLREALEDALFLECVDLPTASLRAGRLAFERERELRHAIQRVERESKPVFGRWLEAHPAFRATLPECGLVSFAEVPGVRDTLAFARHLAATEEVGVVPGEYFGAPGFVRLGFGAPPEHLASALERLARGRASFNA